MDLQERFKDLKDKKESLYRNKTEAEVKISSLEKEISSVLEELKEKYGVNSIQEAKQLYVKKEQELNEALSSLENSLSSYEEVIDNAFEE